MIILEGIDGVGKSTICEYLSSTEGKEIHHLQYSEKNAISFLNLIRSLNNNTVLDRSFITELACGPVLRCGSKISKDEAQIILDELSKTDTTVIYLRALKKDLLKRRSNDEEDYNLILNYYESLNESYDKIITAVSKKLETHTINTSVNNIETVKALVKAIVRGDNNGQ